MKKKIFSLILSLCLILGSSFPVFAASQNAIISGDVTKNGVVSTADVHSILKYISDKSILTNAQLEQADVLRNGIITKDDATVILKIAAGIDKTYPKEYTPWTVSKKPTCVTDGNATSYCVTDGTTAKRILPKTGDHTYIDGTCSVCGKIHETAHLTINGKSLDFGDKLSKITEVLGTPTQTLTSGTATYSVYASDYKKLVIAATTSLSGLFALYTTDTSVSLAGDNSYVSISTADTVSAEIGECFADFYTDNIGTKKVYAAIYYSGNTDNLVINALSDISTHEKLVFYCTNALRAINNISPLIYDSEISDVARNHSKDMIARDYFNHTNPDGLGPDGRLTDADINWTMCGENICAGYPTAFDMSDGWYNSEGHRSNILQSEFTHLGVGIAYSSTSQYKYLSTQNFVKY